MASELGTGDRRVLRDLAVLARLLPRVSPGLTAAAAVAAVAGAGVGLATAFASGEAIGRLVTAVAAPGDGPESAAFLRSVVVVAVLLVASDVLGQVRAATGSTLSRRVTGRLRERVMAATLTPETIDELEDPAARAVVDRARELAPMGFTPGQAAASLVTLATERLQAIGAAVGLVVLGQPVLAALLVALRVFAERQGLMMFWSQLGVVAGGGADLRRASYFRDLALTPAAAKEIRVFGLGRWAAQRNRDANLGALEESWRARGRNWPTLWFALASLPERAVPAVWFGLGVLDGSVSPSTMATGLLLAGSIVGMSIGNEVLAVNYGTAAVPAVLALERRQPSASPPSHRAPLAPGRPTRSLSFESVRYAYPGTTRPALDGLDLHVPAGQRLAVVGLNGAGKTTLVKLAAGLIRPDAGRVSVDGHDLAGVDPRSWRRSVAVLFQDFVHYELSGRDNVALGSRHRPLTDGELGTLGDQVGLDRVVAGLPRGWDTVLSPTFTDGSDLSGGEWQRLALARALYAIEGGARLLILDEPTANLDVRAEAQLYGRFLELTGSGDDRVLTTILISHRFSTVRRADRIVVLDGGAVIEDGSHDELLAAGGRYAQLFTLQARRFADDGGADA